MGTPAIAGIVIMIVAVLLGAQHAWAEQSISNTAPTVHPHFTTNTGSNTYPPTLFHSVVLEWIAIRNTANMTDVDFSERLCLHFNYDDIIQCKADWQGGYAEPDYAISGYVVQYKQSNETAYKSLQIPHTPPPDLKVVKYRAVIGPDIGASLVHGTEYDFRVAVYNEHGRGPSSAITLAPLGPAAPPTNLTVAENNGTSITFTWTPPADTGGVPIVGYFIQYSLEEGIWSQPVATPRDPSVKLTNLEPGTEYGLRVRTATKITQAMIQPLYGFADRHPYTLGGPWSGHIHATAAMPPVAPPISPPISPPPPTPTPPISTPTPTPPPDTVRPVIVIIGANPQTIVQNQPYTELGARCTDNSDSSPDITIHSSAVDTRTAGTYTVTYTCTDEAGNTSQDTRTVRVVAVKAPVSETPSEPEPDSQLNSTTTPDPVPEQPQPEQPQPTQTPIILNISAFYDANNDGTRNANETVAADVTVYISNTTGILDTGSNDTILYTAVTGSNGTASIEIPPEAFYAIVLPDQGLVPTTHLYHHNNTAYTGVLHEPAPVPGQTYEMNVGIRDVVDRTVRQEPIVLY